MELIQSSEFAKWLQKLRDDFALARIATRLDRLREGNSGDVKPVGSGISEMRIHYGAGYRVYFMQRGVTVVILLCGGDKSTQAKDIVKAKQIAAEWKE